VIEEAREVGTGVPHGSGVQLRRQSGALSLSRLPAQRVVVQDASMVSVQGRRARVIRLETVIEGQTFEVLLWRSYEEGDATVLQLSRLPAARTDGNWSRSPRWHVDRTERVR